VFYPEGRSYLLNLPVIEEMEKKIRKKTATLPMLHDILKLSQDPDTYTWVCATMLKCVVSCSVWKKRYFKEPLSEIATESDESFLILTLENNFDRWMHELTHCGEDIDKKDMPEARYTNSGVSQLTGKGSSKRFHGWSREGYLRFNELYLLVREDRKLRANFEVDLKAKFEAEHVSRRRQEESEDEEDEIFPANDMSGVKQPEVIPQRKAFSDTDSVEEDDDDTSE
jgi:hypothetical protein